MRFKLFGSVVRSAVTMEKCIFRLRPLRAIQWRFGHLLWYWFFIWLILTDLRKFTYDSFSEGEVEDDERPEEASTSAKEPMAPGKWNISTRQNLE